jgi:hypothetical protein
VQHPEQPQPAGLAPKVLPRRLVVGLAELGHQPGQLAAVTGGQARDRRLPTPLLQPAERLYKRRVPQFDCDDQRSLAGSQPSPGPAPAVAAGRGGPLALVRSLALLGLLVALAAGGDWLRRHQRPREAT